MLKREDLEYLAGVLEKLGEGDCPIPKHFSEDAIVKLGGASPALALACLDALSALRQDDPEWHHREIDQILAALAAGGVEVG